MRSTLKQGLCAKRSIVIDAVRTIDFLGAELRVYASPELVRDVETVCRELLLEHCDAGEDSVGTGFTLVHGGAALAGMTIDITVSVRAVDGRKVQFAFVARADADEIGHGQHERAVVDVARLRAKLSEKRTATAPS